MSKRIVASIFGTIAVLASVLPLGYAFEISKDFGNPNVPFWSNVLGEFFMCSIALTGMWVGLRLLRFASTGQSEQSNSWVKPVLLGIGCFFPGLVFSLPLTMLWAIHTWPGDDGKIDLALEASLCIGVAAAITCTILLFRKRRITHTL
jgi:uncharacterized membrane protein